MYETTSEMNLIVINQSDLTDEHIAQHIPSEYISYRRAVDDLTVADDAPRTILMYVCCCATPDRQAQLENLVQTIRAGHIIVLSEISDTSIAQTCWQHPRGHFMLVDSLPALPALIQQIRTQHSEMLRQQRLDQLQQRTLVDLAGRLIDDDFVLNTFIEHIALIASTFLDVDRVSIWFFDDDHQNMTCQVLYQAHTDQITSGMQLNAKTYPVYFAALQKNQIIVAHNAFTEPIFHEFKDDYLKALDIQALLDAPIRAGGDLIGIICIEHTGTARVWTIEEQRFLVSMAGLVEQAISNHKRRTMQATLREKLTLLTQAESLAKLGYFELDLDTVEVTWSDGMYRIFEQPKDKQISLDVYRDLIADDEFVRVMDAVSTTVDTGQPYQVEHSLTLPDGTEKRISAIGEAVYDKDGFVTKIFGIGQDISERVKAEERERQWLITQEKIAFLTDFFGTVSHDIKTPLSVMNTTLYLLEHTTDAAQNERRIQQLKRQVTLISEYITDMLLIARLDNQPQLTSQLVSLAPILNDIVDDLLPNAEGKNINLIFDNQAPTATMLGEKSELRRVFTNLIENAVNYTPAHGEVTVQLSLNDTQVIVSVQDTGIGIPTENINSIFDPFYRTDAAQVMVTTGTGLGLNIVKRIVERHAGEISVESEPDRGTTFTLTLPALSVSESAW